MKVYKSVRVTEDGEFTSVHAGEINKKLAVTYEVGKTIEAPVGGLFVFDTLQGAVSFWGSPRAAVLECRVAKRNEVPIPSKAMSLYRRPMSALRKVWRTPSKRKDISLLSLAWPPGSRAFTKLKVLRVIP